MPDAVWWVYAVVPDAAAGDARGAPAGVDDAEVRVVREGGLAALASPLDAGAYAPDRVASMAGEVAWIGPRAVAHDGVTTWASERGDTVPLPLLTLFAGEEGVRGMLVHRRAELQAALARVHDRQEYGVRVYRLDERLAPRLAELSDGVAALEARAASASPGQRYLLERKLADLRRDELRRVGAEVARLVHERLAAASADTVTDPLPPADGTAGPAVLNGAYLVARDAVTGFREALTALVGEHEPRGFRFEFTGPWAPYHFARGAGEG